MKPISKTLPLLALASLVLSGCGGDKSASEPIPLDQLIDSDTTATEDSLASRDSPTPTECRDAMAKTATETNYERYEQFIVESLSVCQTADEWMEMLKAYPGAMGVTNESFISDEDFVIVCFDNPDTTVCKDAVSTGRMPSLN